MERGIPEGSELADALADFLAADVIPQTSGRLQFQARVARNVAAMLARELRDGPTWKSEHRACLAELGAQNDDELAASIRAGDFDDRLETLCQNLARSNAAALAVVNPRYS